MGEQRLFVAMEIPEPVRKELREALEPWRAGFAGARWVSPENWHVTLLFLGATAEDEVSRIRDRLGDAVVGVAPLITALTAFGGFPSTARARVVWAGLDDEEDRIGRLARSVRAALGADPENRPFSAHVTVARNDRPRALPKDFIATALPATPFTVGELVLFRSHLGRPAPRYEPLTRFPFGSPN